MSFVDSIDSFRDKVDVVSDTLREFDWEPLIDLVEEKTSRDNEQAVEIVEEFKKFLFIKFMDKDYDASRYSPSNAIDEIWHLFLLFPKDYFQLCQDVLGESKVLDHNPFGASDTDQNARFENTLTRYEQLFNEAAPSAYWDDDYVADASDTSSTPASDSASSASVTSSSPPESPSEPANGNKRARLEESFSSEDRDDIMTIYVKTLTGKMTAIDVVPLHTISDLKQHMLDEEGIPLNQQRILFNGRYLEDGRTLAYYKIQPESRLDLILSLQAC